MDINNSSCIGACAPPQIVNVNIPINDITKLCVYNECGEQYSDIKYSYSTDSICWSCYMTYEEILENTIELLSDYYIRARIQGQLSDVEYNGEHIDYSTQLESGFNFTTCEKNSNTWNPYANIDPAVSLYQQMSENVACMAGTPIIYFKVDGVKNSGDITFKEYALKHVTTFKNIKLIIPNGSMPSSKPEFSEFGLDWQVDWETEISKGMFATAFGPTVQPSEGDLIWIPLMGRMWMVNEAYEEKKNAFMWHATTWKLALVKYQEDDSVDLDLAQPIIDEFVNTKYEDIFSEEENNEAQIDAAPILKGRPNDLYPIFKSDSVRKYITCNGINIVNSSLYFKNTLVCDNAYAFDNAFDNQKIIYQKQYCGDSGTISFILKPEIGNYSGYLLELGRNKITIMQSAKYDIKGNLKLASCNISINQNNKLNIDLIPGNWYLVWLRWSRELNIIDFNAAKYTYPENIPIYKLNNYHYYFDIDNTETKVGRWNQELNITDKQELNLNKCIGTISDIKLFDIYNDDISEIIQQYPTNKHLLINDVVRPLVGLDGAFQM